MKLLQENKALHADEFSNASPYIIMFGPDKCGATNKASAPNQSHWPYLTRHTGSLHLQTQEPQDR